MLDEVLTFNINNLSEIEFNFVMQDLEFEYYE